MGLIERLRNHAQWVELEFDRVPPEDLEQAADALEKLRFYLHHATGCTTNSSDTCTCGLTAILKELTDG